MGMSLPAGIVHGQALEDRQAADERLPRREYKDGVMLSVIGMGGVVLSALEQQEANRAVAQSIERGVNYFDVAPSYGDSEVKLGLALEGRRDEVFVACKTLERTAEGARRELERSLERLRMDHLDLYQFHAVSTMEDVNRILAADGAGTTFLQARDEGKARFLGLSAHAEEPAIALMDRFPCDSVLFPINFTCWAQGEFGPALVAHAKEKGVRVLAIKALAKQRLPAGARPPYPQVWYEPVQDRELARRALAFALGEGAVAAVPPGAPELYRMALDLAGDLPALTPQEREALLRSSEDLVPLFRTR